ncbi:uncharacterized protein LOC127855654 [Dreissena polymorpha]|uniref:uncharacterized protein LOC127855654 n=1 Tax=Dreissena polymorpha TaxID=45954 RepID=UPI0022656A46|nr:uncharacterized protein LOC127855654 [Dreissena polymorpha]
MALKYCLCSFFICCLWVGSSWTNKYSEPYSCYGDVCNLDHDAQFCDGDYMLCRQCNVVREDCFTGLHVCNCSQFCTKYRRDIEERRAVEGCVLPPPPVHGHYNVNTTRVPIGVKLEVTCAAGYTVRDDNPITCSNLSIWTGSLPFCTDAEQYDVKNNAETKRLLPSAPDERKIDFEDNSKTEHDPNERHPPMTSYQHEDGTRGNMCKSDMNSIPDGTSHAENNTLNGACRMKDAVSVKLLVTAKMCPLF